MESYSSESELSKEIRQLISLRQEGGYWDFKRQWHKKKGDLLHDIVCMANNLQDRAAYIVIGIDENQDYAIVDVEGDPNRKSTQNIVDFLKDKKFAGGIRPFVHVEVIRLNSRMVDVIVIENSHNTPFYLTENYEDVRANYIYTRIIDTNTPKDRSADIDKVEYLWRKRFHIDESPIDKFYYYLGDPGAWREISNANMGYFYKRVPEYTIFREQDESRDGYEYYLFAQVDTRPHWYIITLKYHQTAIAQFLGIALDGGRSFVVAPRRAYELHDLGIPCVGYYVKGTLEYRLMCFYYHWETPEEYSLQRHFSATLQFRSEYEHNGFFSYVKDKMQHYNEIYSQQEDQHLPPFPELGGYNMERFKQEYRAVLALQKMLKEFRTVTKGTAEENIHANI